MENKQPRSTKEAGDRRFQGPTFIDPLTGLFNQYYLYHFLPEELDKAKIANYPLAILMIDLDGFKNINDKYGHRCGDEVLRQLAEILKNSVRKTDMVIRYAGDEFTILLPTADLKTAQMLSQRFIQDVGKHIFKTQEQQDLRLTISVGFSIFPFDAEEIGKLIDLADKALYLSKQKGKNRVSHAKEVALEAVSYLVAMESFPCPKFIGRKEELDRLKHIFDSIVIKTNLLQVTLISGEVGIGKTRLLNELDNYVQNMAAVIGCRASSAHTNDPYHLFAQGIANYIDKIGLDSPAMRILLSQLSNEELDALSLLVPPLAKISQGSLDLRPQEKNTRFFLFKAFLDFLIELNKTQAVAVVFDDIHWADKASLELMHYLAKQEKNKRILIACSFAQEKREANTKEDNDFRVLLEELGFQDNITQIKLKNFSLTDATGMSQAIFPGLEAERDFYQLIYEVTKGNPAFVEEMLKSLVESGVIFYQDNRWQIKKDFSRGDMPLSIEEVIKRRIRNLDEETKEMIVQAAVVGDDFSVDILKKIGNQDEGLMFELLNRAKKMRLIDELEPKGKFGFINKNIQNALYNELDEQKRNKLHYQIGRALEDEHKDNVYNVAGELAFHFDRSAQENNASEYSRQLLEKTYHLFNPSEIIEYLDKIAREVSAEKVETAQELTDKNFKQALNFIRTLQGAVKSFQLYPAGTMRSTAVKQTAAVLQGIWEENERLNLGEAERSPIINGKRISPKETVQASIEFFLSLMLEQNLKTLSFLKGVSEKELDRFIDYFSRPYRNIKEEGGWSEVLKKEEIKGIKVDEVHFVQLGADKEFEGKKRIEDIMLMEFLLGKMGDSGIDRRTMIQGISQEPKKIAQTIIEASREAIKAGEASDQIKAIVESIKKINTEISQPGPQANDYAKYLANVILEFEPSLRNQIIRSQSFGKEPIPREIMDNIIKSVPDEVIVDMVADEYKANQGNLLATRDSVENILVNDSRKKEVLPKLEAVFAKSNMVSQEFEFISGQIKWEDLPLERRIGDLIKLPDEYYETELEKIKLFLQELVSLGKREELDKILLHLMVKAGNFQAALREKLRLVIIDFIKSFFTREKLAALPADETLDGLLKKINIELEPKIFSDLLEIFKEVMTGVTLRLYPEKNIILEITKPEIEEFSRFVLKLLVILCARLKWEEGRNPAISRIIRDFLDQAVSSQLLEMLIYGMVSSPGKKKLDLKDLLPVAGDKLMDAVIKLETKNANLFSDSFKEYVIRKNIADLLRDLGDPALEIFREKFSQRKENVSVPLVELVGHLKKKEWVELLMPLLRHQDNSIRRSAVIALADIGSEKALEAIAQLFGIETDKKIRLLAKEQLEKFKH